MKTTPPQFEYAYRRGFREGLGAGLLVAGLTMMIVAPLVADAIEWLRVARLIP